MPKGRTLDEFAKTFDKRVIVPGRIKAALKDLGARYLYEGEFIKKCKLSTTDFARYRKPFLAHCVNVPHRNGAGMQVKRAWAGTTKFAAALRKAVEE